MRSKFPLSAFLVTLVLVTLLVQSAQPYENSQYGFSITPPEGWGAEENIEPALFVFRDPSNYTGATIEVLVNQSGLPQEDPFLASMRERYLRQYLYQAYEGYLITDKGARVVGSLNGYQIKLDASVGDAERRFVSVIFIETNQTFYIICGALSPAYDNLSSVFKESIDSFKLMQSDDSIPQDATNSTSSDNVTTALIGVSIVVVAVAVAALVYMKKRKR